MLKLIRLVLDLFAQCCIDTCMEKVYTGCAEVALHKVLQRQRCPFCTGVTRNT